MAKKYGVGVVKFARLHINKNPKIAYKKKWKTKDGAPYFAIIKDGKLEDFEWGFLNESDFKNNLNTKIQPLIGP